MSFWLYWGGWKYQIITKYNGFMYEKNDLLQESLNRGLSINLELLNRDCTVCFNLGLWLLFCQKNWIGWTQGDWLIRPKVPPLLVTFSQFNDFKILDKWGMYSIFLNSLLIHKGKNIYKNACGMWSSRLLQVKKNKKYNFRNSKPAFV